MPSVVLKYASPARTPAGSVPDAKMLRGTSLFWDIYFSVESANDYYPNRTSGGCHREA